MHLFANFKRPADLPVFSDDRRIIEEIGIAQMDGYEEWLAARWPGDAPLAPRHHRVYQWFDALRLAERPVALTEVWPRGGGKSTTVQRGVCRAALARSRRFCLYITATQDQANDHLATIAAMLEREGEMRLLNRYGNSQGWRSNMIRTRSGFAAIGIGLDVARRGVKLDDVRPDLIVIDDLDEELDTARTTRKKIQLLTKSLLPTGSASVAIIYVQNLISEMGIMAQLVSGRAEFLADRIRPPVEPAVVGLVTEAYVAEDGATKFRITGGTPTWPGQSLATCEAQINAQGLQAFLHESQHEVYARAGYFFEAGMIVRVDDFPPLKRLVRAWDFAATQGGGDYTAGVLIGIAANRTLWVLDVVRAQLASNNAKTLLDLVTAWDNAVWRSRVVAFIPQDPGAAGKRVAQEDMRSLSAFGVTSAPVERVKKSIRARPWARAINEGNVRMLADGRPRSGQVDEFLKRMFRGTSMEGKAGLWNQAFIDEHRLFTEDDSHDHDDQVDAASDAAKAILEVREVTVYEGFDRDDP